MKKRIILLLILSIFILSSCNWFKKKEEIKDNWVESVKINPIWWEAKNESKTTISEWTSTINFNN